jgi:hypothetical protein
MILAQLQNTWHNCKIHGTNAKQIVKLQKNSRQQNKCFLTQKLPAAPPCHCIDNNNNNNNFNSLP